MFETESEKDAYVHAAARNWREAVQDDATRALCAYAEKLTNTPAAMEPDDIEALRDLGFSDRAIHDATQIISYFNYINRIADALGVEPEKFIRPWGSE